MFTGVTARPGAPMERTMHEPRHTLLPFAAALMGVGFLSLMDAFMKEAALVAGAYTATLLRAFIGAAIVAPVWLTRGPRIPSRAVMKLHVERGIVADKCGESIAIGVLWAHDVSSRCPKCRCF